MPLVHERVALDESTQYASVATVQVIAGQRLEARKVSVKCAVVAIDPAPVGRPMKDLLERAFRCEPVEIARDVPTPTRRRAVVEAVRSLAMAACRVGEIPRVCHRG